MRTKDLERELGLTRYAIQYYEKEGFIQPKRDENGYRNYSEEDVQVLQLVKFLRNLNISIDDVKAIMNGQVTFHECLKVNKVHLDKQIESLTEIQNRMENIEQKNLPLIPAFDQIKDTVKSQKGLGFRKTTNTVSLGRRLTKSLAIKKCFFAMIPALWMTWLVVYMFIKELSLNVTIEIILTIGTFVVIHFFIIGTAFQLSTLVTKDVIDHSLNQSIEFLETGIRYYKFEGIMKNIMYFIAVLKGKEDSIMCYYRYEDIEQVKLDVKQHYMKIGTPIASELYALDFTFDFKDGHHFYFYWPMILDDDARYIGYILEKKVNNIKDDQHILDALKNGMNFTDYLNHQ